MWKAILIGVAVLIVGIAAITNPDSSKSVGSSESNSSAPAADTSNGADLHLMASESRCYTIPTDARLVVSVSIRNTGSTKETMHVRPWRRYSDGSTNDSVMDEFDIPVPPHTWRNMYGMYDYNALDHDLLECGVYLNDAVSPTPLQVG
jgi:hypothetical protein